MVSEDNKIDYVMILRVRLNPCFGGIWSLRPSWFGVPVCIWAVLILVLVGYGLWAKKVYRRSKKNASVLILVLVGYGLWGNRTTAYEKLARKVLILVLVGYGLWVSGNSLDRWSWEVLILVLVGYGLWVHMFYNSYSKSLNPCFGGIWSLSFWFSYIMDSGCLS